MSSKQKVFIVIGMIIIIGVSFVVGLFIGQQNAPKNDLAIRKVVGQTFYANIDSIQQYNDGSFHLNVKGLEINDINYKNIFLTEMSARKKMEIIVPMIYKDPLVLLKNKELFEKS